MCGGVEALFTSALGLVLPWGVDMVELDTARRRVDFEVRCAAKPVACPACGATALPVHRSSTLCPLSTPSAPIKST